MLIGGYQIIDLSNYDFRVQIGGGEPIGTSKKIDADFIPLFLNRKAKLFSGFTLNGVTSDDFFAECTRINKYANNITKYYHLHIDMDASESGVYPVNGTFKVEIDTENNTIYGTFSFVTH